jgi:hypothetical protein
VRDQR